LAVTFVKYIRGVHLTCSGIKRLLKNNRQLVTFQYRQHEPKRDIEHIAGKTLQCVRHLQNTPFSRTVGYLQDLGDCHLPNYFDPRKIRGQSGIAKTGRTFLAPYHRARREGDGKCRQTGGISGRKLQAAAGATSASMLR
jgi:hypothetical protein